MTIELGSGGNLWFFLSLDCSTLLANSMDIAIGVLLNVKFSGRPGSLLRKVNIHLPSWREFPSVSTMSIFSVNQNI